MAAPKKPSLRPILSAIRGTQKQLKAYARRLKPAKRKTIRLHIKKLGKLHKSTAAICDGWVPNGLIRPRHK